MLRDNVGCSWHLLIGLSLRHGGVYETRGDSARRSAAGVVGSVRLGFIDSALSSFLPALLRSFQSANPQVDIQLMEATPPEQIEGLRNDQLDIGILVLPISDAGNIRLEPLIEDQLVAVLPESHHLAKIDSLTLTALADEPWVLFAQHHSPGMHTQIVQACAEAGFIPRVVQHSRQMQTTAGLVAGEIGIALMPRLYAQSQPGRIVCREITGPGTPIPYNLSLAYRELSPCAQALRVEAVLLSQKLRKA
ncbi:LysR family substrate-binding domain-containing protein [Pseudomonas sp. P867]|uniref:LysR family substrate-binding domain-containing protein n=1 Tax=Pseudomonas sp. P867 TaxID=2816050 RepID=UPI001CA607F6|nr:LysR family substrate-binding domain-containing protein [Pseudomonas sp. P867]MBY8972767.1 LysR family substrate-binding domain-containing protein [Pseudomonas sp. P867]